MISGKHNNNNDNEHTNNSDANHNNANNNNHNGDLVCLVRLAVLGGVLNVMLCYVIL